MSGPLPHGEDEFPFAASRPWRVARSTSRESRKPHRHGMQGDRHRAIPKRPRRQGQRVARAGRRGGRLHRQDTLEGWRSSNRRGTSNHAMRRIERLCPCLAWECFPDRTTGGRQQPVVARQAFRNTALPPRLIPPPALPRDRHQGNRNPTSSRSARQTAHAPAYRATASAADPWQLAQLRVGAPGGPSRKTIVQYSRRLDVDSRRSGCF